MLFALALLIDYCCTPEEISFLHFMPDLMINEKFWATPYFVGPLKWPKIFRAWSNENAQASFVQSSAHKKPV